MIRDDMTEREMINELVALHCGVKACREGGCQDREAEVDLFFLLTDEFYAVGRN